ncbi:MAG: ATP-grasp domain-containing protein [Pseudomonadota bacterium]
MTETVLLTLGRLPKGLELARALHGAGCRVLVADPFGLHVCKPSRAVAKSFRVRAPNQDRQGYLDDLADIIDGEGVDLVVPVSEEAVHVSFLRERLPEGARLFGPPRALLQALHDKFLFNERVAKLGLRAPATFEAGTPEAADFTTRSDYVVKPREACSGTGVKLRKAGAPLTVEDRQPGNLVQERRYGQEVSSLTLARDGRVLGTAVYRGLIYSGTVSCCFERVDTCPDVHAFIERFVSDTDYSGFIAFDFILDGEGGAWPLECNPRLTSGVHLMRADDLAAAVRPGLSAPTVRLNETRRYQEGHTTLTETYAAIFRPKEFFRRFGYLLRSKDVIFSMRDPLPFFLMTPMSWTILRKVIFGGKSFGEAATDDIVWDGRHGDASDGTARARVSLNDAVHE